jgi:hypothetical protein
VRYCLCREEPCRCEDGFERFVAEARERSRQRAAERAQRRLALLDLLAESAERDRREGDPSIN